MLHAKETKGRRSANIRFRSGRARLESDLHFANSYAHVLHDFAIPDAIKLTGGQQLTDIEKIPGFVRVSCPITVPFNVKLPGGVPEQLFGPSRRQLRFHKKN